MRGLTTANGNEWSTCVSGGEDASHRGEGIVLHSKRATRRSVPRHSSSFKISVSRANSFKRQEHAKDNVKAAELQTRRREKAASKGKKSPSSSGNCKKVNRSDSLTTLKKEQERKN